MKLQYEGAAGIAESEGLSIWSGQIKFDLSKQSSVNAEPPNCPTFLQNQSSGVRLC